MAPTNPIGRAAAAVALMAAALVAVPAAPARGSGYLWPVKGPVVRGFDEPASPYSAGHRGIDIAVRYRTPVVAAAEGVVRFAGWVGGERFVSIDHPDGLRTTYSFLAEIRVGKGWAVAAGALLGATGTGHSGSTWPHLHFGVLDGDVYLDPLLILGPGSVVGVIRLVPILPPDGWPVLKRPPSWPATGDRGPERRTARRRGGGSPLRRPPGRRAGAEARGPPTMGPRLPRPGRTDRCPSARHARNARTTRLAGGAPSTPCSEGGSARTAGGRRSSGVP
ncbi:MAG: M23 family metallopeptidase [Actinobacteria bacterium]|nr:M23 family metallopeptidase [Actinomycetota bacterium]